MVSLTLPFQRPLSLFSQTLHGLEKESLSGSSTTNKTNSTLKNQKIPFSRDYLTGLRDRVTTKCFLLAYLQSSLGGGVYDGKKLEIT